MPYDFTEILRSRLVYILAHERGGPQTLSPITFVLLRAASGALDELQAAASGMAVGKQVPGDTSRSPRGLLSTNCDQTVEHWPVALSAFGADSSQNQ